MNQSRIKILRMINIPSYYRRDLVHSPSIMKCMNLYFYLPFILEMCDVILVLFQLCFVVFILHPNYFGLPRVLFNTCVGTSSLGLQDTKGVLRGLVNSLLLYLEYYRLCTLTL